ncbi:MAG: hypothetical protein HUJ68_09610 [Clostridia bacterium]|nr:hypothetical protein [Clostridia bacterium]
MTKENKKPKQNKIVILIIVAIFLLILGLGFKSSFSRYVYNVLRSYYLASKDFYLYSDKLSLNHSEFEIENNWSGAETYPITVNLNSKKNDKVFASSDIEYNITYTCSNNIECTLNKNTGTIIGSANNGENVDYFIVNINPKNGTSLQDGDVAWVDITVTSTNPYEETISGKLYIGVGTEDITYQIMDSPGNPYIEVSITNSLNENKDVSLTFSPQVVLLDMTSNFTIDGTVSTTNLGGYNYVTTVTSNVNALETSSVKLYKVDPTLDYTYQIGDQGTPIVTLSYDE